MFVTLLARFLHRLFRKYNRYSPEGNRIIGDVHAVLPETATRHRRVIIVGDIHGCYTEFQTLLDKCYFRKGVDILITVGDLVNKGPGSPQVLQMVKTLGAKPVRGNHDDAALAAFGDYTKGRPLKKEKYAWVQFLDRKLAETIRVLPFSISLLAYNVVVVHAGLVPGTPLQAQDMKDMITMRDVVPVEAFASQGLEEPVTESEDERDMVAASTVPSSLGTESSCLWNWDAVLKEAEAWAELEQMPFGTRSPSACIANRISVGEKTRFLDHLKASERYHPAGKAWASVWRGPAHVFFGHDATRRLQKEEWATGLDGGCVYGGMLYAAVLPALDEGGNPIPGRGGLPEDAEEFKLGTSTVAHLVGVPATAVHSPK